MRRLSTFLLIAFLCGSLAPVAAARKPEMRRVYMFGFAASFKDSTACQTVMQVVDSAWIDPQHKFLMDRSLYSLQFNNYLVAKMGQGRLTCAVFFDKNKAKAEKKFQKVRNKYRGMPNLILQSLGVDVFRFEPQEWVESEITETTPVPAKSDSITNSQKK